MTSSLPHAFKKDLLERASAHAWYWMMTHKDQFLASQSERLKDGVVCLNHDDIFSDWKGEAIEEYYYLAIEKAVAGLLQGHFQKEVLVRYCTRMLFDMASKDRDIHMYTVYVFE